MIAVASDSMGLPPRAAAFMALDKALLKIGKGSDAHCGSRRKVLAGRFSQEIRVHVLHSVAWHCQAPSGDEACVLAVWAGVGGRAVANLLARVLDIMDEVYVCV